jgi:hypothetical protein
MELGLSETHISQVIAGKSISRRTMEHIAEKIEATVQKVFPEYFDLPETEDKSA